MAWMEETPIILHTSTPPVLTLLAPVQVQAGKAALDQTDILMKTPRSNRRLYLLLRGLLLKKHNQERSGVTKQSYREIPRVYYFPIRAGV